MNLWKRILAVLIMVCSALLSIVCIGGIAGTWVASNSLTNDLVQILTGVENGLGVADEALGQIDTQMGSARSRVADFEEAVQAAGENVAANPVLLTALSERLDLGIAPAVNELRDAGCRDAGGRLTAQGPRGALARRGCGDLYPNPAVGDPFPGGHFCLGLVAPQGQEHVRPLGGQSGAIAGPAGGPAQAPVAGGRGLTMPEKGSR